MGSLFGILVFQISDPLLMFPALIGAVFFGFGVNPILAAVASELFPTNIRATALGVARSIFGTVGGILGPIMVGVLADPRTAAALPGVPLLGDMGSVVAIAVLMNFPAILMLRSLPETANVELENVGA
jgi:MFS family permease